MRYLVTAFVAAAALLWLGVSPLWEDLIDVLYWLISLMGVATP